VSLNAAAFQRFLNPVFIETGTCGGNGVAAALDAGFKKVLSVELGEHLYTYSQTRFEVDPRVRLWHGLSVECLPEMCHAAGDEPCTIWLDAHDSGGTTVKGPGDPPLLAELEMLNKHLRHREKSILLADDMSGYDKAETEQVVRQLFPEWSEIFYLPSCYKDGSLCRPDDVLVARKPACST
jgi:hypothetical protein